MLQHPTSNMGVGGFLVSHRRPQLSEGLGSDARRLQCRTCAGVGNSTDAKRIHALTRYVNSRRACTMCGTPCSSSQSARSAGAMGRSICGRSIGRLPASTLRTAYGLHGKDVL